MTIIEVSLWLLALTGAWHVRRSPALILAIALPWLLLLFLAGIDRMERYWWLWATLVILILAALERLSPRLRLVAFTLLLIAVLVLPLYVGRALGNETALTRIVAIAADSYGGAEIPGYQSADALGQSLSERGVRAASIGYDITTWGFEAPYHAADPRYKVGMQYDLLLRLRYGVTNTNAVASGSGGAYTVKDSR